MRLPDIKQHAVILLFNMKMDADDRILGFTTDWVNTFARKADKVIVITMQIGRLEVDENVTVYSVGKEKGFSKLKYLIEFYRALRKVLKNEQIELCIIHMIPIFLVLAGPFLRLKSIPSILWYTHKSVTWYLRVASFFANYVITASQSSFRLKTKKKHVVGHAVDTRRFVPMDKHGEKENEFVILTVGRISHIKRLEILIEAVPYIQHRLNSKLVVRIIGEPLNLEDEKYREWLKTRINELGLNEVFKFEGGISFFEIHKYYQNADCFVNLCPTGGIDKAVLEAMSCAVPVFVTNTGFYEILSPDLAREHIFNAMSESLGERLLWFYSLTIKQRRSRGYLFRLIVEKGHSLSTLVSRIDTVLADRK